MAIITVFHVQPPQPVRQTYTYVGRFRVRNFDKQGLVDVTR
jgi:hypothetical protein